MTKLVAMGVMDRPKRPVAERGEFPDPKPLSIPTALKMPESTDMRIKRLMEEQRAWARYCDRLDEGRGEAHDFDTEGDEIDGRYVSPYEDRWKMPDQKQQRRFDRKLDRIVEREEREQAPVQKAPSGSADDTHEDDIPSSEGPPAEAAVDPSPRSKVPPRKR